MHPLRALGWLKASKQMINSTFSIEEAVAGLPAAKRIARDRFWG